MLTRFRRDDLVLAATALLLAAAIPLGVVSCDKVPLLAPTGTVITLIPTTNTVSLNSQVDIIATVIENGQAAGSGTGTTSRSGAGTPVQNGTVITFTTTVGRIEPTEARTHNGQVTVKLVSSGISGTARVTAFSGGASSSIEVKVGATAADRVVMTANPSVLPASGGQSVITATVADVGGGGLAGIPVTFTTSAGNVSPTSATTGPDGTATSVLSTTTTATVTARIPGAPNDTGGGSGATGSNSVTVTVGARALSAFSASPNPATVGQLVSFTITANAGANISGGTLNFGDGRSEPIGPLGGPLTHVYNAPGNYTASAVVTSASGVPETFTTTVTIGTLPASLSASPNPGRLNELVTFTVSGTTNAQVDHYEWTFDDGTSVQRTAAPQLQHSFSSRGRKNVRVDVIGLNGGVIASAPLAIDIQ